jgi:hypothetical protein
MTDNKQPSAPRPPATEYPAPGTGRCYAEIQANDEAVEQAARGRYAGISEAKLKPGEVPRQTGGWTFADRKPEPPLGHK